MQSVSNNQYEIIVVDDFSTDDSLIKLNEYANVYENIFVIKNKKNIGVAASVNKAVLHSRGKYIIRVDSDDYVNKEFLSILGFYIQENKNLFGVSCDYYLVSENNLKIKIISSRSHPISCGIMYNKKKFVKYGMYNQKFRHREEEELRYRLGKKYLVHNLNFPLYRYQLHLSNKTRTNDYKYLYNKKINLIKFKNNRFVSKNFNKLTKNIVAIIPARGGSKRLKNKNIYKIWGKPMIYWVIQELKKSSYISSIYVSSDSENILNYAKMLKVNIIKRPGYLSDDKTLKMEAINHSINYLISKKKNIPSLILSIQANSPTLTKVEIDKSIEHLIENNLSEVVSVDNNLNQNGAIRVMKYPYNFQNTLSTNLGCVVTDILDVHTKKDINKIIKNNV
jgi:glycosyltransferase involved in cell wall biosynthesis